MSLGILKSKIKIIFKIEVMVHAAPAEIAGQVISHENYSRSPTFQDAQTAFFYALNPAKIREKFPLLKTNLNKLKTSPRLIHLDDAFE